MLRHVLRKAVPLLSVSLQTVPVLLQVVHALLDAAVKGDSSAQPGISHARWRQLTPDAEGQVRCTTASVDHGHFPTGYRGAMVDVIVQQWCKLVISTS